jgi:signal transduction histidine kinase
MSAWQRIRGLDPRVADVALAVGLAIVAQVAIWTGQTSEGPRAVTVPIALATTLALAFRRRRPLAVAGFVTALWVVQAIAARSPESLWALVLYLAVAYSAGAYLERRPAVAGAALLLAGTWITAILDPANAVSEKVFTPPVLTLAPWLAGRAARRYWSQARRLDALNVELEHRREEDVRAAARDERARIARELHDVVAHSISVMVVQAGAAEQVLAGPPEAEQALRAIRETGKSALLETRRLVGILRTDAEGLALAPQPGLAALDGLIDDMRAAGLEIEREIHGPPRRLPAGPDLAAYRIVQEALTNTLRHAGPTRVRLELRYRPETLELQVADEGPAAPLASPASPNGGHGLIGMRERAALYGGHARAGHGGAGGWVVRATLPLEDGA